MAGRLITLSKTVNDLDLRSFVFDPYDVPFVTREEHKSVNTSVWGNLALIRKAEELLAVRATDLVHLHRLRVKEEAIRRRLLVSRVTTEHEDRPRIETMSDCVLAD